MSLYDKKMPSLRDKFANLEVEKVEEIDEEKVEEKKISKGRRLNK